MSNAIREQHAAAQKDHEVNRKAYRAALAARAEADEKVRAACAKASDSANTLAALTAAVERLPAEAEA